MILLGLGSSDSYFAFLALLSNRQIRWIIPITFGDLGTRGINRYFISTTLFSARRRRDTGVCPCWFYYQ